MKTNMKIQEVTAERKEYIKENYSNIVWSECPGGPHEGCCEFCSGSCTTAILDGKSLSKEEMEHIQDLYYEHLAKTDKTDRY